MLPIFALGHQLARHAEGARVRLWPIASFVVVHHVQRPELRGFLHLLQVIFPAKSEACVAIMCCTP